MESEIRLRILKNFSNCFEKITSPINLINDVRQQNFPPDEKLIIISNGKQIDLQDTMKTDIICTTEQFFNTEFTLEAKIFVDHKVYLVLKPSDKVSTIIKALKNTMGIKKKFMAVYVEEWFISSKHYILELCTNSIHIKFSGFNITFSDFFAEVLRHPIGKFNEKRSYNYWKNSCSIFESTPLNDLFIELGKLDIADLSLLQNVVKILCLDCLKVPDRLLTKEMNLFRNTICNCFTRPFNYPRLREIVLQSESTEGLNQLILDTSWYVNFIYDKASQIFSKGLGTISPYQLCDETIELAQGIAFSKPSINCMKLIFRWKKKEIIQRLSEIFIDWKNNERIYLWNHLTSESIFIAMASIENYVFIESSIEIKSVFEQAYTIVHELQHLITRKEHLIYSPIIFAKDPELKLFFQNKTESMPLEAGHLY